MFKSKLKTITKGKQQPEMEETLSLILNGCKMAKDLESNLRNMADQPHMISRSCEEIIRVFITAGKRLNAGYQHQLEQQHLNMDPSLQEWLRTGYSTTTTTPAAMMEYPFPLFQGSGKEALVQVSAAMELGGGREVGASIDVSSSGKLLQAGSSSSQRPRRRKDEGEKYTIRIPAPRIGNTEIPPEDGFTWRKYGQKEILGSRHPRGYYRCTHQKLYNCPAKKQVQRLDDDPHTFEVTYRGQHTCHMSSTAPSVLPPPMPADITQGLTQTIATTTTQQPQSSAASVAPLGSWLSMEFSLGSGGGGGGASSSSMGGGGSSTGGGAGPSTTTTRYGKDHQVDYTVVADMADAMFNPGSSGSNSMEFIFPSIQDKWEPAGDKKH